MYKTLVDFLSDRWEGAGVEELVYLDILYIKIENNYQHSTIQYFLTLVVTTGCQKGVVVKGL